MTPKDVPMKLSEYGNRPPHAPTPELTDKNHCETELIPLAMSSHGRRGEGIPLGLCPHEHITSQRPPHFYYHHLGGLVLST